MQNNLTSLARVTEWLGNTTVNDNAMLVRLIGQASRFIHGVIRRPSLFRHSCSETFDGNGRQRLFLRRWPVLSVSALSVDGESISASPGFGEDGYRLTPWDGLPPGGPQAISLTGYMFSRGQGNVSISYVAGYVIQDEPHIVPGDNHTVAVAAPHGSWGADAGVTYADGTAMTKVTSAPAQGQYAVQESTGIYTFAAADEGEAVLISYSYIPADIEQLCIELVAERYRYKDRIGQSSKTLGGQETTSFLITDLPPYLKALAQPYIAYGLS